MTSGFNNLWGAGRFKMRKLDHYGLDAPWGWATGTVCVEDRDTVVIPINYGFPLSSDIETFKAVIYWYDRRHEDGVGIDDIDLLLKTTSGTTLEASVDAYDNKERVYYDGVGGKAVELHIDGWRVTADDEGCGTDSMKVYFALLLEDADRDDTNGPCLPIEPGCPNEANDFWGVESDNLEPEAMYNP